MEFSWRKILNTIFAPFVAVMNVLSKPLEWISVKTQFLYKPVEWITGGKIFTRDIQAGINLLWTVLFWVLFYFIKKPFRWLFFVVAVILSAHRLLFAYWKFRDYFLGNGKRYKQS